MSHPYWTEIGIVAPDGVRAAAALRASHDRVVGFTDNRLRRVRGYEATVEAGFFDGQLRTVSTDAGHSTAATPDQRVITRWNARPGTAVYLMRKGDWWRVGSTGLHPDNAEYEFGPGLRARQEQADDAWVLTVLPTAREAHTVEHQVSEEFGISERVFMRRKNPHHRWSQEALAEHHAAQRGRPLDVLAAFGRDLQEPIWTRGTMAHRGCRAQMLLPVCSLVPGWMELATDAGAPVPKWSEFTVGATHHSGQVYTVHADRYVADGIVMGEA